jgi:GT2 family glycosyltransferase
VIACSGNDLEILVIDDASPSGLFVDSLPESLKSDRRIKFVRNESNLGFVKTCNWGMANTSSNDVILLNSDTIVTKNWLQKLQLAAYSADRVATVTPFTNNGTICSLPRFLQDNPLPSGFDPQSFADLVETVALRTYPELPTCVGFCVYLKRHVIDLLGGFDEAFGRGYSEENDFSCRARDLGFVDILDDATFILHKGSLSFQGAKAELQQKNLDFLVQKHPDYLQRIVFFIDHNPLKSAQMRVISAIARMFLARILRGELSLITEFSQLLAIALPKAPRVSINLSIFRRIYRKIFPRN